MVYLNRIALSFFLLLSPEEVHKIFSFKLGATMGSQSFLGNFESFLSVLQTACLKQLYDSFFVSADSRDFGNDLSDGPSSFAELGLTCYGPDSSASSVPAANAPNPSPARCRNCRRPPACSIFPQGQTVFFFFMSDSPPAR